MSDPVAFNPYAAPSAGGTASGLDAAGQLLVTGNRLVVAKDSALPDDICLKCGSPEATVRREQKLQYAPPWVYVFIVFNVIVVAILYAVFRKTGQLAFSLCPECDAKWKTADRTAIAATLWLILGIVLAIGLLATEHGQVGALVGLTSFVVPIWLLAVKVKGARLTVHKIDKVQMELSGPSLAALERLGAAPGARA